VDNFESYMRNNDWSFHKPIVIRVFNAFSSNEVHLEFSEDSDPANQGRPLLGDQLQTKPRRNVVQYEAKLSTDIHILYIGL
jgi:hypothetical protein